MSEPWPAPRASAPLDAAVTLPGSKSLTNRALVLAALADGPSIIERPLRARDTSLMTTALGALGAVVADMPGGWRVAPAPLRGPARIDCGLAGTVLRFLPPLAALADGPVDFDGDLRARERPIQPLVAALRNLGVPVSGDRLPFRIHGSGSVGGGRVTIDASASSQFVSALLLVGARYHDGIDVRHCGDALPSAPHIAMTVSQLRARGVFVIDSEPNRWVVQPGPIAALTTTIEPDLSNAAPFLAAALATGGRCRIEHWPRSTDQAGDRLRAILAMMGARVEHDGRDLVVTAGTGIDGVTLDMRDVSELTPVVAALCALASSPSRLSGIAHMRGHETDRLAAIASEVNGLGGRITELADGLHIEPTSLHGGVFSSFADHRMAHAGAVLGLAVDGVSIDDVSATAKTFPEFVATWAEFIR